LDDPGDDQRQAGPAGDLDGIGSAFVGMDSAEEQQVAVWAVVQLERVRVDAVVDGGQVGESGVAIGVADGDVGTEVVVLLVHGHDGR
jgi:hypothetical protein